MKYAYLFEARGIQRFLFASGKLRDMLGGSELLDYMCAPNGFLDQTLSALKFKHPPQFVRKAGGAFYAIFEDRNEAERLQSIWRISCANWFPGIECVDALVQNKTARGAIKTGIKQLNAARNHLAADLPRATPITERSQRTGLPAVPKERTYLPVTENMDAVTLRQNTFERPNDAASPKLESRFLSNSEDEINFKWPINFENDAKPSEKFPLDERRFIGLLHADGNGLGKLLRVLNSACEGVDEEVYISLYKTFSDGLTRATQNAAHDATQLVIVNQANQYSVLPARPLVLGGDDLSILLRADIALDYTKAYLKAFERHTRESMALLKEKFVLADLETEGLPDYLTACAGLCFMKCNQPFQSGYALAEGLCNRAKTASRQAKSSANLPNHQPMPASIAFHKIQDSLIEDASSQFEQNFTFFNGDVEYQTAFQAYGIDEGALLPHVEALEELIKLFQYDINDRPLREIATLLRSDFMLSKTVYRRWRKITEETGRGKNALKSFDMVLNRLCNNQVETDLPFAQSIGKPKMYLSPLGDLLTLLTIKNSVSNSEEMTHAK